jgi:hypothetical protein
VPLAVKDEWVKKLSGTALTGIRLTPYQNGVKQSAKRPGTKKSLDKLLFTHVGVSGPTVLNMSRDIGELLKYGEVVLSLDLLPEVASDALDSKLIELFTAHDKKMFKNAIGDLVPPTMSQVIVDLSGIDGDATCNSITREMRVRLGKCIKAVPIHIEKLLGADKAIISNGGVALTEVDFRTMSSRLYPNLYLIGDLLHIDRPSGGYSLQLCWTTGYVAGSSVI